MVRTLNCRPQVGYILRRVSVNQRQGGAMSERAKVLADRFGWANDTFVFVVGKLPEAQ